MFENFYGMTKTPFTRTIPTNALYRDNDADEFIDRLKYASINQLFAVVYGDSGTGKTTLLRRFHDELPNTAYKVIYIAESKLTPRLFYKAILNQLGIEASFYSSNAKLQLQREVGILKGVHGLIPVLIVDECHLLARDMFEEVRFLLNFKMDSESPLALVLSGQTELWDKLRLQPFTAIRQRIDIQCNTTHLDESQSAAYIKVHLSYAGYDKTIFTDAAIDDIFKFTGGTMRFINKVCTASLMYGAQNHKTVIDDHMVKLIINNEFA